MVAVKIISLAPLANLLFFHFQNDDADAAVECSTLALLQIQLAIIMLLELKSGGRKGVGKG